MPDPRIYYDPKTKKIVRTDPPGLMKLIRPVEGTSLIAIPLVLLDLENRCQSVPVQHGVESRKVKKTNGSS